jgi:hypothetical protein
VAPVALEYQYGETAKLVWQLAGSRQIALAPQFAVARML